jgi:hypothetical protein
MSLAQHVTSLEGVDREVVGADDDLSMLNKGLWRPLNFDPLVSNDCLESLEHSAEPFPHIPAYKVSSARRFGKCSP